MARVCFTQNLQRHVASTESEAAGETVRDALDSVFERNPLLRGYILDNQGALRRHMAIFVDGIAIRDRVSLSDAVSDDGEIFVMQALSGG